MIKVILRAVLVLAVLVMGAAAWDVATYDAKAWRADYEHLKQELARRYANLDWIVSDRGLDLRALDAETGIAIDNARSRVFASLALYRFVQAFADPHLRLVWADRTAASAQSDAVVRPSAAPSPASCEAVGYEAGDSDFDLPFDGLRGWRLVRGGDFPSGVAGDLGVLRIAAFGEDRYLAACRTVFRAGLSRRELQLAVRVALNQELRHAIAELKTHGIRRLLVDLTGNGGGSEWVVDVVAMMTGREMTRQPTRRADPACDRSGIWRGEAVCPVLVPGGEPTRLVGTGEWDGALLVATDRRTGSAAEDFVVWLKDNGIARTLGDRTAGAGCGYLDGGGRIALREAPFDVMAPNCARFLSDGTNEIEGVAPDVRLSPDSIDRTRRAAELAAVLQE